MLENIEREHLSTRTRRHGRLCARAEDHRRHPQRRAARTIFVKQRYASWDGGLGRDIEKGRVGFRDLSTYMLRKGEADANASGRQEFLENLINEFI